MDLFSNKCEAAFLLLAYQYQMKEILAVVLASTYKYGTCIYLKASDAKRYYMNALCLGIPYNPQQS
jgi:hypothetical protein